MASATVSSAVDGSSTKQQSDAKCRTQPLNADATDALLARIYDQVGHEDRAVIIEILKVKQEEFKCRAAEAAVKVAQAREASSVLIMAIVSIPFSALLFMLAKEPRYR